MPKNRGFPLGTNGELVPEWYRNPSSSIEEAVVNVPSLLPLAV